MTSPRESADRKPMMDPRVMRRLTFVLLVAGVTYWFFDLIQPFLMPVFWAVVLAVVFNPVNDFFRARWKEREGLAATVTTLIITLAVLLPATGVILSVIDQGQGLYERYSSGELDPNVIVDYVEARIPRVQMLAVDYNVDFDRVRSGLTTGVTRAGQWIVNKSLNIGQNFLEITVEFFLMLYFLWFFLRDGRSIIDLSIRALPLGDTDERALFDRFATVARATLKGTLIVAITQGTLGGILFWAIGIEGALFWGVVMTVLSLLPVGGSAIVWVPAAIIMAITGAWGKALVIVAFGGLAIGLVDNFLRPLLVGRDTQMPDYLVLIATLGGIAAFGLAGFVIGPVVAALFLSVWEMMMREFEGTAV